MLPERVSATQGCWAVVVVVEEREARASVAAKAEAVTRAASCQEEALAVACSWRREEAVTASGRGRLRRLSLKEERKRLGESSMRMSENNGRLTGRCRVESVRRWKGR